MMREGCDTVSKTRNSKSKLELLTSLLHFDRNKPMVPEDGFDYRLIGSVSSFSDSRLAALLTPQPPEHPPISVVVGGIRPRKVASPNPLVTAVADMTRPNSVESLRRVRPIHSISTTFGFRYLNRLCNVTNREDLRSGVKQAQFSGHSRRLYGCQNPIFCL
mgnify:CR=1 FL=1